MAKVSSCRQEYSTPTKISWRKYLHCYIRANAISKTHDGRLLGKWVEPINESATCFDQHLQAKLIDECDLIGLDRDIVRPRRSKENVELCRKLFYYAEFHNLTWKDWCDKSYIKPERYLQDDLPRYFIYDTFTATCSVQFNENMEAVCCLIRRLLPVTKQAILVVNADITYGMTRYQDTMSEYLNRLYAFFIRHSLPQVHINLDTMYRYKLHETKKSDEMGTLIFNFQTVEE